MKMHILVVPSLNPPKCLELTIIKIEFGIKCLESAAEGWIFELAGKSVRKR